MLFRISIEDSDEVMKPVLLKLFNIGSITISTNDGYAHSLITVRRPEEIAGAIRIGQKRRSSF